MDKFEVNVTRADETYHFEVIDYMHHSGEQCKFKVFRDGKLVASFEPDANEYIRICRNQGGIDEEVLYMVADEIEHYHW